MFIKLLFFTALSIGGASQLYAAQQGVTAPRAQGQSHLPSQSEVEEFFAAAKDKNAHQKVFELIQKYGVNIVNAQSALDSAVLITAASGIFGWSDEEFERLLQVPGIDKNVAQVFTPLTFAINSDQLKKIKLLIKYGADLNAQDSFGFTPLMDAAKENKPAAVTLLLNAGANTEGVVNRGFYFGKTFQDLAAKNPAVQKAYDAYKKSVNSHTAENLAGIGDLGNLVGQYL